MRKIILFTFLFLIIFSSYTQKPKNDDNIKMGVTLKPIITIPDLIESNKDFNIQLIEGLSHNDLKWHYNDTIIDTPKNLILNFSKKGEYTPYILDIELKNYKIVIY